MPRYVDHSNRRDFVTEVAADLIATSGIEALTIRRVATEAGFSTAVVSHYFDDKRDLQRSTFRAAATRSGERFEAAVRSPVRTIASCLEALLPLDAGSRRDWLLFMAFWGIAASDQELAGEQRRRVRSARTRVFNVLREERGDDAETLGQLRVAAGSLLTIVQGISSQAVFDPQYWTARRQGEELRRGMDLILGAIVVPVA